MGLQDAAERKGVSVLAHYAEGRYPVLKKLVEWMKRPGFKRGVATVLGIVAILCHRAGPVLQDLCTAGYLTGAGCKVDPASWLPHIETLRALVDLIGPNADLATILVGAVALIHAKTRKEK